MYLDTLAQMLGKVLDAPDILPMGLLAHAVCGSHAVLLSWTQVNMDDIMVNEVAVTGSDALRSAGVLDQIGQVVHAHLTRNGEAGKAHGAPAQTGLVQIGTLKGMTETAGSIMPAHAQLDTALQVDYAKHSVTQAEISDALREHDTLRVLFGTDGRDILFMEEFGHALLYKIAEAVFKPAHFNADDTAVDFWMKYPNVVATEDGSQRVAQLATVVHAFKGAIRIEKVESL